MDEQFPIDPPHLVPGASAYSWARLQFVGALLVLASLVPWLWLSVHPEFILFSVAAVAVDAWTIWGFRRAAYRERAAGYCTVYGDTVEIGLAGDLVFRLFSTRPLFHLDPKTGKVIRRPLRPTTPEEAAGRPQDRVTVVFDHRDT